MEQLQIAFSPYYEVIRDNANGFEKLLIYTNRFKKKNMGSFKEKKIIDPKYWNFFIMSDPKKYKKKLYV